MGELRMPSLGAGMESGTLVAWRIAPGNAVRRGDVVAEVETEKGVIEIEIFEDGVVDALLVTPGTKLPVGAPLARIRAPGAAEAPPPIAPTPAPIAATPPAPPAVIPRAPTPAPPAVAREAPAPGAAEARPAHRETPAARQLAREAGLSLEAVHGTGAHGVVTRGDVLAELARRGVETPEQYAAPKRAEASTVDTRAHLAAAPTRKRISPLARRPAKELGVDPSLVAPAVDGVVHARDVEKAAAARTTDAGQAMRRAIAAAMSKSKREIPHYYLAHPIDLGPALAWLERENAARSVADRLLYGVLLLKSVALALAAMPELNAHWTGESAPPIADVHLGVAIALRQGGLIAPAIHAAQRMPLGELMRAFKDLVQRTRRGTIRGSELADATITVTSLGERGVETVYPVINPPQVAMVGFGKVLERPWVVGGEVRPRPIVTATLAADHRVSDGHRGGLFLAEIERLLMHPEEL